MTVARSSSGKSRTDGVPAYDPAGELAGSSEVLVAVAALRTDSSVRSDGINEDHVAVLADVQDALPPIVVHRPSMRVVDGLHRVRAARHNGQDHVRAVFVDGDDVDALVVAVRLNTGQGLPLSRRDRRTVVERIAAARPEWSDRRIAAVAGVSHKTVGAVRHRPSGKVTQLATVIGQDGRVRPRDPAGRRREAAELWARHPEYSARQIARATGLSATTVLDVRRRREAGLDAAPRRGRPAGGAMSAAVARAPDLDALGSDPSLRYTTVGRTLLRLLSATAVLRDAHVIAVAVPAHRRDAVVALARTCADRWLDLAGTIESIPTDSGPGRLRDHSGPGARPSGPAPADRPRL